jgi:MYXO-CTERM domain-containing protein
LDQSQSAIAFGASEYLAVWRSIKPSGTYAVLAVRVSPIGVVLDDPPIVVSDEASQVETPGVAFDGSRFLVTWTDYAFGQDVIARYVDPAGTLGPRFPISNRAQSIETEAAVTGGNGLAMVVWTDTRGGGSAVRGSIYNSAGNLVRGDFVVSTNNPSVAGDNALNAAVEWGGPTANNFLVTYLEGNLNRRVMGELVDNAGNYLSLPTPSPTPTPSPAPFAISSNLDNPYYGFCCDPCGPVVNGSCDACDATCGGQPATCCGDGPPTLDFIASNPTIGVGPGGYFVAWQDERDLNFGAPGSTLYGRTVGFSGTFGGADAQIAYPPPPTGGLSNYVEPQLTFAGGRFFAIWRGLQDNVPTIFGGAFDSAGAPLNGNGVKVTNAQRMVLPINNRRSSLASDGTSVMGAVAQGNNPVTGADVLLLHTSPSPIPSPVAPLLLGAAPNYQFQRNVATNGEIFLLTWEDNRNGLVSGVDIYGLRVDKDGNPIDTEPFVICNAPGDQFLPSAAATQNGANFLVVWSDGRNVTRDVNNNPNGSQVDIYGTRVAATGSPLDGNGFKIRPGSNPNARLAPTVAANDAGWLVAWEDWWKTVSTEPKPSIWFTLVSSDTTVGSAQNITVPSDDTTVACAPAAIWDGQRFFVAYEQPCTRNHMPLSGDIFGNWVGSDGTVNFTPVPIGTNLVDSESSPQLATDGNSKVAVVWRGGTGAIRGALLDDNAAGLTSTVQLITGSGAREAPSIAFTEAGGVASFLVTWIDANPVGVRALRTDASLMPAKGESPFFLSTDATFRVLAPPGTAPFGFSGADQAGYPKGTPPAGAAALPSGEALVVWGPMLIVGDVSYPRLHYRTLGLRPQGAPCEFASACANGFCTAGVCCGTMCDQICQACGVDGCIVTPSIDLRCGDTGGLIPCSSLSSTCRTYMDQPLSRCSGYGQCAEAGSLDECVLSTDAADGTSCTSPGCSSGATCTAGSCLCPGEALPSPTVRMLTNPVPGGCSVAAGAGAGDWGWLLLALLGAALWRRRLLSQ